MTTTFRPLAFLTRHRRTMIGVALLMLPLLGVAALMQTVVRMGAESILQTWWAIPVLALPAAMFALYEAAPSWMGARARRALFVVLVLLLVVSFPVTAFFGPVAAGLILIDRRDSRVTAGGRA